MRYLFVDCRWSLDDPGWGRAQYRAGHIPGAVFLDLERELSAPPGPGGRHPLPAADDFARAIGAAGIDAGAFVVAYGSLGGAERLWWLLRHFGHDGCGVIDLECVARAAHGRRGARRAGRLRAAAARRRRDRAGGAEQRGSRSSWWSTHAPPPRGAASRTRSTASRAASLARSTHRGTSRSRSCPPGELVAYCGSGVTACVTSTASTSPAARAGSTPARGRSGSSTPELPRERGCDPPRRSPRRYAARYCSHRCGIFGAASRMKSTGAGGRGGAGAPCAPRAAAGSPCAGCRRARGDDVLPDRVAAARARDHVVERQPAARRCRSRRTASRHARTARAARSSAARSAGRARSSPAG